MAENAELNLPDGQTIVLPVITGTENEKAIDISRLRAETGHITLDPGYWTKWNRYFPWSYSLRYEASGLQPM